MNTITDTQSSQVGQPRTREDREALTRQNQGNPAVVILGAGALVIALVLGFSLGEPERNEEEFMTEVEYYQRQLDVQRAEFNGYRAGVNESRGQ